MKYEWTAELGGWIISIDFDFYDKMQRSEASMEDDRMIGLDSRLTRNIVEKNFENETTEFFCDLWITKQYYCLQY